MCGRFDNFLTPQQLAKAYQADVAEIADWTPRYNIAPSQHPPLLFNDGIRQFQFARFGMRPEWWEHRNDFINIRAESVAQKPFFRKQAETNRCVLPVTGFYEWQNSGNAKIPYRITRADKTGALSLACLWGIDDIKGHNQLTFGIVTTSANGVMGPIHNRMPVILSGDGLSTWLNPSAPETELHRLLVPLSSDQLRTYRVSRDIGNPNVDHPRLIEPLN